MKDEISNLTKGNAYLKKEKREFLFFYENSIGEHEEKHNEKIKELKMQISASQTRSKIDSGDDLENHKGKLSDK